MDFPILSTLIALPVVAAVIIGLLPKDRSNLAIPVGMALSSLPLALGVWLFTAFEKTAIVQFSEVAELFTSMGVVWHLGIDGISLPLVLLTAVLVPISIGVSGKITDRPKMLVVMILLLQAGMFGVFLSLNLILFFVFFEAVLVPMYFIIGIWGSENRVYAAVKFFLFTAFGSALMFAGILYLGALHNATVGFWSFEYTHLLGNLELSPTAEGWLFWVFALAFAIKVPLFPFHTWLPDAHVQAPTAGSVLLAGVMLKLGTYGLMRFNLILFPHASYKYMGILAVLAVIGIVYGAAVAIVQPDLKKLVAYSSVSHLGFIVLGIFSMTRQGSAGAVLQGVNHGLITGGLFMLVGLLYERRHTKRIADFGGLAKPAPVLAGLFLFMSFASVGLPGLAGFPGEFLVLIGSFETLPWAAIIGASGVILAAIYLLWAYQRVFTGEAVVKENQEMSDLTGGEKLLFVPLVILIIVLGLFPRVLLDKIEPSTDAVVEWVMVSNQGAGE